tara:strand:- start:43 stop:501 length:459 start_codon:yes stop_codon:yes gene_type:complete
MKQWMCFHASAVDTNTVSVHDSGTNVDMAAFPADALTAIAAKNGGIELTFNDTGKILPGSNFGGVTNDTADDADQAVMGEALEATLVTLTVANASIPTVMKDLIRVINRAPHGDGLLLFDEVNSVYPGDLTADLITAIVIARTTTTVATTVA